MMQALTLQLMKNGQWSTKLIASLFALTSTVYFLLRNKEENSVSMFLAERYSINSQTDNKLDMGEQVPRQQKGVMRQALTTFL